MSAPYPAYSSHTLASPVLVQAGALDYGSGGFPASPGLSYVSKPRTGAGTPLLCSCIFLPWLMFCGVSAAECFWIHYIQPTAVHLVWVLCAAVILGVAFIAKRAGRKAPGACSIDSQWLWFMALMLAAALGAGIAVGNANYLSNLQPYYQSQNLQYYPNVDPTQFQGNQLMDAGRVLFTEGSALNTGKAMGFRNLDWYCVAPIAKAGVANATYDFWAVGLNCCGSEGQHFTCGEYNNPKAKSGLRLMADDQRPFFRLAVEQAEARHNLRAPHPLFFHWMQDPEAEEMAWRDQGIKNYNVGVFASFAASLVLCVLAVVFFSVKA